MAQVKITARKNGPYRVEAPEGAIELGRSEEHTSELQSPWNLVCRLLLEKKKISWVIPLTPVSRMIATSVASAVRTRTARSEEATVTGGDHLERAAPRAVPRATLARSDHSCDRHTASLRQPRVLGRELAAIADPSTDTMIHASGRKGPHQAQPLELNPPPTFPSRCFFFLKKPAPTEISPLPPPAPLPT